jgi:hypothetical protein
MVAMLPPIDALEPVPRQAVRPIAHRRDHGRGPEADRAREAKVVLRLADIEGRPDQDVLAVQRGVARDDLRA